MIKIKKENKNYSIKKSLTAALSLLIGLVFLLVIQGCPTPVDPNGGTNTNGVATNTNVEPMLTSGAARIFADAASVASVGIIGLVTNESFAGGGAGAITVTVMSSDGDGSSDYMDVQEAGDGAATVGFAGFALKFSNSYNLTAVANTAIKFSVRVATGGPTSFGVALETTGGSGDARPWQARKPVTFTADGTWQQVTIPASDFTSIANRDINAGLEFRGDTFDPSTLQAVVFSLDEAVNASTTAINIDIDEIQFIVQ